MTQLSLIPLTPSQEEKNRRQLLASIEKKRAILQKLVVRSEMLKIRLDMLKQEYMVKIGSLVIKDNHLDLEIIRYRNLLYLLSEGKSYDEAVKELEHTYYAEELEIEKEEEKVRQEAQILQKRNEEKSEEVLADIKKLWKKLIALFHPDLTQDPVEKKRRETIMKQINQAYEEGDFAKLAAVERERAVTNDTPVERLEDILILIENEIIAQEKLFIDLKDSKWYRWDIKLTKSNQTITDIFRDVERKLLNDIVAKMGMVKELEKEIAEKR